MASVLIIGDTHAPAMKRGYVDFLKRTADHYQPDRIVHIGDLVDWHSISYHETEIDSPAASPLHERNAARRQVRQLHAAFPNADWLLGNHDCLPNRKAKTAGLLEDMLVDPVDYWGLDGWKSHPRFSSLTIDGVEYSHGENGPGGKHANERQAVAKFRSIVIGHWHSCAGVYWYANDRYRIFGLSVGSGVDNRVLQMAYGRRILQKPMLGCGVVLDGQWAVFEPWLLRSR